MKLSLETIATFGTFASLREARDAEISIPPPPPVSSEVPPDSVRAAGAEKAPLSSRMADSTRTADSTRMADSTRTPDSSRTPDSRKANGRATPAPRRARTERPAAPLRGKKAAELAERKNASPVAPTTGELLGLAPADGGENPLEFGFLKTV